MVGQPETSSPLPEPLVVMAKPLRDARRDLAGAARIFEQLTSEQPAPTEEPERV